MKDPRHVLYTMTTRRKGAKWAVAEIYAVRGGILEHVARARYQPGATAGHAHECRSAYDNAWDTDDATTERWEVREIEPTL